MQVVILCGGKGERLREHTQRIPKPLVEIGEKPILWHIMKGYAHYGFKDFILCLGYKGELIEEYFQKKPEDEWNITFADTGLETQTGGRIKKIEKLITNNSFLATYGDGVSDINIKELIAFHNNHKSAATITCTTFRSNFGLIDIDDQHTVIGFQEKPFMEMWINAGFFVFDKKIFEYLTEDSILENKPMKQLAQDKQLKAYKHKGYWQCMDTYKDTRLLNDMHDQNEAKWISWEQSK